MHVFETQMNSYNINEKCIINIEIHKMKKTKYNKKHNVTFTP